MNNLKEILKKVDDLGFTLGFTATDDNKNLTAVQLIDIRSPYREVVFLITQDNCEVIEFDYDCNYDCESQSEETAEIVDTFDEALNLAAGWC